MAKSLTPHYHAAVAQILIPTFLIPLFLLMVGCQSDRPEGTAQITVAAAADLVPAFEELALAYEVQTKTRVVYSFGSTGMLAQQIANGAPVDVFAAANLAYVTQLEEQGLILPDTKAIYARGRIVIWTPKQARFKPRHLQDLMSSEVERIAIANPDHAPYGIAARQALESANMWETARSKIIYADNVRQAMQFAATGNADVAIIALSLSLSVNGDSVQISEEMHQPLDQALAVIRSTEHQAEARSFVNFVSSPAGQAIMAKHGFIRPDPR